MTSRRDFLVALTAGALQIPRHAEAQQAGKVARIGFLAVVSAQSIEQSIRAFRQAMREHGWIEGQNLHIEFSYESPGGPGLAERVSQLTALNLRVIVADSTPTSLALKRANVSLPVVFAAVSEPVEIGLAESLARPGRNFTGFTTINRDLMPKRIELLKELVPRVRGLVYMGNPDYASYRHNVAEITEVAGRLSLKVDVFELRSPADFDASAARLEKLRDVAFVVEQSQFFIQNADRMVALEQKTKVPAMYADRLFVDRGGTLCYGVNRPELYRRAAGYVDRILKGTRPSELPIEQPTKFDLVINLKTAKALGLKVSQSLLVRADQLIE